MKITESLKGMDFGSMSEKEVLTRLMTDCGVKLREAVEVCRQEFGGSESLTEAACSVRMDSLPAGSHLDGRGVTVVDSEWED